MPPHPFSVQSAAVFGCPSASMSPSAAVFGCPCPRRQPLRLPQYPIVHLDRLPYLRRSDILISGMTSSRVARSHLQAWEPHQCLVAQRGRTKRLTPQSNDALQQRMIDRYARRLQSSAAWCEFNHRSFCARWRSNLANLFAQHRDHLFIAVGIGSAAIDHKSTGIGNYVVHRTSLYTGHRDLHRSQ